MSNLRDRIADAVWDEARTIGSTLSMKASGLIADAVIAVVSDEYINSRGMFHEPDRCMEGDGCQEEVEDENL